MLRLLLQKAPASGSLRASVGKVFLTVSSNAVALEPSYSVKDVLIDLTFVDPSGARRKVKGVIGK
jgi:hypothetical protein